MNKGQVAGKSRATFYISDDVLDDLHEFWGSFPRNTGLSKSEIVERAITDWLSGQESEEILSQKDLEQLRLDPEKWVLNLQRQKLAEESVAGDFYLNKLIAAHDFLAELHPEKPTPISALFAPFPWEPRLDIEEIVN